MEQVYKLETDQIIDGKYRIEEFLGEGGIAYNYKAVMLTPPYVRVVLKQTKRRQVLNEEISDDRFQMEREYRLLQELNHPGIPQVFDMFEVDNVVYFAREYRDGELLEDLIKTGMETADTEQISWQLMDIISYLHQFDIIYRDLKPSNVLVDKRGRAFLFDFGTARFHSPHKEKDTIALGTPGFAAPEQYGKNQTDARADIYSFGALLYYMLTGDNPEKRPFEIGEEGNLNEKISNPGMRSILQQCLSLDPDKRFSSVSELKKAILSRDLFGRISTVYTNYQPARQAAKMVPARARAALLILALVMFLSSSFSQYLNIMVERVRTQPNASVTINSDLSMAEEYLKTGNWKGAIRHYELARSKGQLIPADALKLAGAYYQTRQYGESLKNLNMFIDANPGVSGAYQSRALIQDKLGHYNAAISDMDKYLDINKTARGYIFRSVLHYHNQDFHNSVLDLERAKDIDPSLDSVYTNLGFIYTAMGDYKKARVNLDKSIVMNTENNYAFVIRGWLNILEGDNTNAKSDLSHPMKGESDNSSLHCALGFISMLENDKEEFVRQINEAYSYDPENSDIYYIGAIDLIKSNGKPGLDAKKYIPVFQEINESAENTAATFLEKAHQVDPNGADIIWYKQGAKFAKNKEARKLFEQLIQLENKNQVTTF